MYYGVGILYETWKNPSLPMYNEGVTVIGQEEGCSVLQRTTLSQTLSLATVSRRLHLKEDIGLDFGQVEVRRDSQYAVCGDLSQFRPVFQFGNGRSLEVSRNAG